LFLFLKQERKVVSKQQSISILRLNAINNGLQIGIFLYSTQLSREEKGGGGQKRKGTLQTLPIPKTVL
jgi:hypothetical protein